MKICESEYINCNKCGSDKTVFVFNKKQKKFREIFFRCQECKYERDLTHMEASSYCIWQMDNKNWKKDLVRE